MAIIALDLEAARLALAAAADRFAHLADGADTSLQVPGLTWTVRDLIAHVATETRAFAQFASGELTPEDFWDTYAPGTEGATQTERMAELNRATIAAFDQSRISHGGELVRAAVSDLLACTADLDPAAVIRSVEGDLEPSTFTTVVLAELLVHCRDLAKALSRPVEIPPADARLVLAGIVSLFPLYLDAEAAAGMDACFEIRVRGGPRFAIRVVDRRLEVSEVPTARVDCRLSADPVALLLVATGRQSQWHGILRGQLVAWGRRPWLALKLTAVLRSP